MLRTGALRLLLIFVVASATLIQSAYAAPRNSELDAGVRPAAHDSTGAFIDAALRTVRQPVIVTMLRVGTLLTSKEHPLVVSLAPPDSAFSVPPDSFIKVSDPDPIQVAIIPSTHLITNSLSLGMQLPGSASDGSAAVPLFGAPKYVTSGTCTLEASFLVNGHRLLFKKAQVTFTSDDGTASVADGAACELDGVPYRYARQRWTLAPR